MIGQKVRLGRRNKQMEDIQKEPGNKILLFIFGTGD